MNKKNIIFIILSIFICIIIIASILTNKDEKTVATSSINNKKIGWGIKRNNNNEQPDLGVNNKKLIEENEDIAIGNKEYKCVYLTFDEGYEAGYTEKILDILKQNGVKATFFITGHYLNSKPELVQRMIQEGHIVGNHIPTSLMSFI